ncbi:hypothetical protein BSKO_07747 [Bryopsis sp. KO-2023]|nr:hypothetical protein BSKO_07747 [Bryopsis sp. KO-2023]
MVLGGSECESALESAAYPGAAWKHCDQNASSDGPSPKPKAPRIPNRRPRPGLSGSLSFGGLGLSINFGSENSDESVAYQSTACTCSIDGRSGDQNTNYKGCQQHSWYTGRYDYWCMVKGGIKCRSATPSTVFEGAAWRSCET